MPSVQVTDHRDRALRFWHPDDDNRSSDGHIDAMPIVTYDSKDAFLSGLVSEESYTISGEAGGLALAQRPEWSNDPLVALAEWVQYAMSFINAGQGTGYSLDHGVRQIQGRDVVMEAFAWTKEAGARFSVRWDARFRIGDSVDPGNTAFPGLAAPSDPRTEDPPHHTLAGVDLQNTKQIREQKTQKWKTAPIAFAESPEENLVRSETGVRRSVSLVGEHTGSRTERSSFDSQIRGFMGQDDIVSYASAFPGHTIDVMVNSYEDTLRAGQTGVGNYVLELIEGTNLTED